MREVQEEIPEPIEIAHRAVQAASDKLATDILMLDLRERCSFADYFVICSGSSERQIKAIQEEVDKALTQDGVALLRREGSTESGWVLLDFGEVIVHVFSPELRDYYRIERIWAEATPVVRVQ
ncbi:MAG TPA: ribosome silencing factor [Dehalococcoidia bacterium]|nr:ribosome silencing factor [Dehalococcoidia bacterium]